MTQIFTYESQPYATELEVTVLSVGEDGKRPFAILDDTVLYPEGGGQPPDHGRLDEIRVLDVQKVDGEIRHVLASPATLGKSVLQLDWPRRYDHMQQHTAQHLLTAVAVERFGWQTTSFHLFQDASDIELDVRDPSPEDLQELEERVNAEIRAARPVTAYRVEPGELEGLGVRSRGLPAGHQGNVRLVEIEGIERNTCGGTHLGSTSEIESLVLLGAEPKRGGSVLRWLAGGRVRRRLGQWEARGAELRRIFGTADDQLAATAQLKLDQLQQAGRQQRALEERLAETSADALISRDDLFVEAHFDDADMGFLQRVARRFGSADHSGIALLTASGAKGSCFLVAGGKTCAVDVQAAGRAVAEALGGRGGGSGSLFQGKVESLSQRPRALLVLEVATTLREAAQDTIARRARALGDPRTRLHGVHGLSEIPERDCAACTGSRRSPNAIARRAQALGDPRTRLRGVQTGWEGSNGLTI